MKELILESTDSTPKVYLNHEKSIFIIAGESRTEDSEPFYEAVINWFREYHQYLVENKISKDITIEMHLDYYNSATARSFIELFATLQKFVQDNISINIQWFYMENDNDHKDQGEELSKIADKLKFELICLEQVS
jgi:heat shock protein HspQ